MTSCSAPSPSVLSADSEGENLELNSPLLEKPRAVVKPRGAAAGVAKKRSTCTGRDDPNAPPALTKINVKRQRERGGKAVKVEDNEDDEEEEEEQDAPLAGAKITPTGAKLRHPHRSRNSSSTRARASSTRSVSTQRLRTRC